MSQVVDIVPNNSNIPKLTDSENEMIAKLDSPTGKFLKIYLFRNKKFFKQFFDSWENEDNEVEYCGFKFGGFELIELRNVKVKQSFLDNYPEFQKYYDNPEKKIYFNGAKNNFEIKRHTISLLNNSYADSFLTSFDCSEVIKIDYKLSMPYFFL
jgi:hypothetical protein